MTKNTRRNVASSIPWSCIWGAMIFSMFFSPSLREFGWLPGIPIFAGVLTAAMIMAEPESTMSSFTEISAADWIVATIVILLIGCVIAFATLALIYWPISYGLETIFGRINDDVVLTVASAFSPITPVLYYFRLPKYAE